VLSKLSSVWKLATIMFSILASVTPVVPTTAVLVPDMVMSSVSVPPPPLRTSPALRVVPFAVRPLVPIVETKFSLPAPPVKALPTSAAAVRGLVLGR
jgi:hypothetical protein